MPHEQLIDTPPPPPPAPPAPSHIDSGDYTYDKLFHVQPLSPPWPDQADARLAALEAQVTALTTTVRELRLRVNMLERFVHRLLNAAPALVIPTGDEND